MAQYAADGRTKNKTQSKGRANQPHSFRAIFLGGDVGNVSLRSRDVSAGNAVEDATHEQQPKGCGEAKYQKPDASADDRDEQDGSASVLVRESTQDRREDQLHYGVGREQQSDGARSGIKARALGIKRQHRNNDTEADQVDEYRREDYDKW